MDGTFHGVVAIVIVFGCSAGSACLSDTVLAEVATRTRFTALVVYVAVGVLSAFRVFLTLIMHRFRHNITHLVDVSQRPQLLILCYPLRFEGLIASRLH